VGGASLDGSPGSRHQPAEPEPETAARWGPPDGHVLIMSLGHQLPCSAAYRDREEDLPMTESSLKPMITYSGLVDDFAQKYDDACIQTLEDFNNHLIAAVLTGHPLLINDGHIIMHPAIRKAVLNPKSSPLQELAAAGYVKILTRNGGDLETLADRMADQGITSAQQLGGQDYYTKQYLPALRAWMDRLREGDPRDFLRAWPEISTTPVFHKVAAAAYRSIRSSLSAAKLREDLEALRRFIDIYESGDQKRRTDWENAAVLLRRGEKLSERLFRELMHAGNEAYQYAWGCALADKSSLVRVETRAPKHTSLDVAVDAEAEPVSVHREQVELYTPNFKVAGRKIGENWSKLADIARTGSEMYYAKIAFQRCIDDYYRGDESATDEAATKAAAKRYSKALAEHFVNAERGRWIYGYSTAIGGTAALIPTMAAAPFVGLLAGLAISIVAAFGDHVGVPEAMMKIVDGSKGKWITSGDLGTRPTMVSNFQIDQQAADRYRRGISTFHSS